MMDDHSFDPRTWNKEPAASPVAPRANASRQAETRPQPGEPARAGWLGMALSFAILVAGAAGAYVTRPPQTEAGAAAFETANPGAALSANG